MKRKKSKLLAFSLLALCFACLAFGVYALKNATLTVSGTIGFTAHDCMVEVEAYIEGDGLTEAGVTATDGHPSEERALNFKSGTNVVTVGGATEEEWEKLGEINDTIYFTDLTDDGAPAPITMTFKVTNLSVYDVYARIANVIDLKEKGVTVVVTEGDQIMQEANESATDETVLTAVFTLDTTKVTDAGLSEGFELKLDFGKYVAPTGGEEGGDVVLNEGEVLVEEDFVFKKYGEEWSLIRYLGEDATVTLPALSPENTNYMVGRDVSTTEMEEEMIQAGISMEDQETSMAYLASFSPFMMNSTINKVVVPSSVTGFGLSSFMMSSVVEVEFEETTNFTTIGCGAFNACTSLTILEIPDSVTTIRNGSLHNIGVSSIVIPENVVTMETLVLYQNENLTAIYCMAESQPETWADGWNGNENVTPIFGYQG